MRIQVTGNRIFDRRAIGRTFGILCIPFLFDACAVVTGAEATRHAVRLAQSQKFAITEVEGLGYRHSVFSRIERGAATLWVFIEGDGTPWSNEGRQEAEDPTARNPLALRLAVQTSGSVIYLGRPCYLSSRLDARCDPKAWTSNRYSSAMTESMNAALRRLTLDEHTAEIVLVGYSGGGTLAALMARDNPRVHAVITIAGNLDTAAWSNQHHYLPLTGSRNPADEDALPVELKQIHLLGDRDANVSPQSASRYLARLNEVQVWHYPKFDHVCCWEQTWPEIHKRIQQALISAPPIEIAR